MSEGVFMAVVGSTLSASSVWSKLSMSVDVVGAVSVEIGSSSDVVVVGSASDSVKSEEINQ